MRAILLSALLVLTSLSGCFGGDEIFPEDPGIPGGLALACLRSSTFDSLVIEIDYEEGHEPDANAVSTLKSRVSEVCDKPGGVTVEKTLVDFSHDGPWNANDVRTISDEFRQGDAMEGDTLYWHFLYPTGKNQDSSVLGVAVDASTVAIFLDAVEDAEGFLGRPSAEEVEKSVTVHEAGHLLGLVNLVYISPVDHEDSEHKGHSSSSSSVMYWAIESQNVGNFITGDLPDEFDDDDKSDLAGMADGSIEVDSQLWP